MSEKRVVRPRGRSAAAPPKKDETYPGDTIELALTVETINRRGQKMWAKAGLSSTQRPDETTEEATDRVQSFVIASIEALQTEFKG